MLAECGRPREAHDAFAHRLGALREVFLAVCAFALRALAGERFQAAVHAAQAVPVPKQRPLAEDQVLGEVTLFFVAAGAIADLVVDRGAFAVQLTKPAATVLAGRDRLAAAAGQET